VDDDMPDVIFAISKEAALAKIDEHVGHGQYYVARLYAAHVYEMFPDSLSPRELLIVSVGLQLGVDPNSVDDLATELLAEHLWQEAESKLLPHGVEALAEFSVYLAKYFAVMGNNERALAAIVRAELYVDACDDDGEIGIVLSLARSTLA